MAEVQGMVSELEGEIKDLKRWASTIETFDVKDSLLARAKAIQEIVDRLKKALATG